MISIPTQHLKWKHTWNGLCVWVLASRGWFGMHYSMLKNLSVFSVLRKAARGGGRREAPRGDLWRWRPAEAKNRWIKGEYGEYAQATQAMLKNSNFSMKLKQNFLDTFLLTIGHGAMTSKDSGTVTLNLTPSQFLPCEVQTQHSWHPLVACWFFLETV